MKELWDISEIMLKIKSAPEYLRCVGFDQNNPHHHLCLDKHMEETEKNLMKLGYGEHENLMLAAALHDIGKPEAARPDKKMPITRYFGHAAISADIAHRLLLDNGLTDERAAVVCWYIRHHDDFINFSETAPENDPFLRKITSANIAEIIMKTLLLIEGKDININSTVRFIVTGEKPSWGKVLPWEINKNIPVNCVETAFRNLLALCRADAMAQSPTSERPTQAEKLERNKIITGLLHEAVGIVKEKLEEKFETFACLEQSVS